MNNQTGNYIFKFQSSHWCLKHDFKIYRNPISTLHYITLHFHRKLYFLDYENETSVINTVS